MLVFPLEDPEMSLTKPRRNTSQNQDGGRKRATAVASLALSFEVYIFVPYFHLSRIVDYPVALRFLFSVNPVACVVIGKMPVSL